jgi:hypothetical protein
MPKGDTLAPAGTEAPDQWKPYKLWQGDLWKCRGCGAEIIVGVPHTPISEHFKSDFAQQVERHEARLTVNDC